MNAVISYLLTEQAQRAQMVKTGQPVPRKQTVTVDVPAEDLDLVQIEADGTPFLDLTKAGFDASLKKLLEAAGIARDTSESPWIAIDVAEVDFPAALKLGRARLAESARIEAEKKAAAMAADLAKQNEAVERFLGDPTLRLVSPFADRLSSDTCYIGSQRITKVDLDYQLACPRYAELIAEAERRNAAAREAHEAKQAEEARLKAAKEAKEAAKEAAKRQFLDEWIATNGSESQKARSAEGLLCRDEAIGAMAAATFASVNGTRYSAASAPLVECTCDDCDECEIRYGVRDGVDCLNELEYERLGDIKASFISHEGIKFVLRTRTAEHDCDHSPNCLAVEWHTCLVKVRVGPWTLQREYTL